MVNELLANSNLLQVAAGICCIILSIGAAGAMIVVARHSDKGGKK